MKIAVIGAGISGLGAAFVLQREHDVTLFEKSDHAGGHTLQGHRYLDEYFRVSASMLKSRGTMLLQAIVIADRYYDQYRRSVDFIQRYIFPGGCLPSVSAICDSMKRSGDFRLAGLQEITEHYPRTLRRWSAAFRENAGELDAMGFDDRFRRLWEFYFRYCEAGFLENTIGTVQMLLARPAASVQELIPQV